MQIPLFGLGLQGKSPAVTAQRRLNMYYEIQKEQDRTNLSVFGTPGLLLFVTFGDTPVRGAIPVDDLMYVVHRGTFYDINNAGTKTSRGTLNTTSGRVDMAYNGSQILIVDGTNGYIYDTTYSTFFQVKQWDSGTTTSTTANKLTDSGATFSTTGIKAGMIVYNTTDSTEATITAVDSETALSLSSDVFTSGEAYVIGDADFPDGATTCDFLDSYFIVELVDQFYISGANNGMKWDALDFATAESAPDGIVRVYQDHGDLVLFGEVTTEHWTDSGAVDFPFNQVQGINAEWGLAAKWSIAKFDNSLMYLAKNRMGEVLLVRLEGYYPKPIDNFEFHSIINGYTTVSDATGFGYLLGGHPMYQINFPSEGTSWLYDGSTNMITELQSYGSTRHRAEIYTHFLNKNYVTDFENGNIYKLDKDTYTDNGETIVRQLRSKHIFSPRDFNMIVDSLQLLMETGVGLATGQGSAPLAMLRYSKDQGHTWSGEIQTSIGAIGNYKTRAIWRRLGVARDWVFEISISDPIKVVLTGANLMIREGVS